MATEHVDSWRTIVASSLDWEQAHATFEAAVGGMPAELRGKRPNGFPHSAWELLEQRQHVTLVGREVPIAAPEYVILHKLRFRLQGASERHLRDIRGMLRVLGGTIDIVALERDAAAFGLTAAWKELQSLRD